MECPSGWAPPEVASFYAVLWKALEVLERPLPTMEANSNILIEVPQPTLVELEPPLPFKVVLLYHIKAA